MGWSFRRSVNLGPLRVNLSRKGVGYSVGAKGFRAGRDAQGRDYTQTSIPGTGIYNRSYSRTTSGRTAGAVVAAIIGFLAFLVKLILK